MDKKKKEMLNRKINNEEFNSIAQKMKVENQNQYHNAKKEGVDIEKRQI